MGHAIGQILPLAVGVAISPIPIIATILMLLSERPRSNGPLFLVGWVLGLVLVAAVVLVATSGQTMTTSSGPSRGISIAKIVLGVLLLLPASRQWRGRPKEGETPPMPKWMARIDGFGPPSALGLGVVLSGVNPKNLILTLGAAGTIAQADLSTGDSAISLAVFISIACIGVAAPLVVFFGLGSRAASVLDGWRSWLAQENAVVMTVLLLVIAVALVGQGISGLSA